MSLLNDVLRDLDHRTATPAPADLHLASDTAASPVNSVRVMHAGDVDLTRWLVWSVVAFACVLGAWVMLQPVSRAVVSAVVPAQHTPVARPADTAEPVADAAGRDAGPDSDAPLPVVATADVGEAATLAAAPAQPQASAAAQAQPAGAVEVAPRARSSPARDEGTRYLALQNTELPDAPVATPTATIKARPDTLLSPSERARRQIGAGDLAAAEETVTHRLASHPDDRAARELQVGLLLRGARYTEALVAIDEGLSNHPDSPKLRLIKARLLAQQGEADQAIGLLRPMTAQRPASREALQMLGALYQQQEDYVAAIAVYRRLVSTDPATGAAWVGLAIALDGDGRDGALDAYRRALALGGLPPAAERYARQRRDLLEAGSG